MALALALALASRRRPVPGDGVAAATGAVGAGPSSRMAPMTKPATATPATRPATIDRRGHMAARVPVRADRGAPGGPLLPCRSDVRPPNAPPPGRADRAGGHVPRRGPPDVHDPGHRRCRRHRDDIAPAASDAPVTTGPADHAAAPRLGPADGPAHDPGRSRRHAGAHRRPRHRPPGRRAGQGDRLPAVRCRDVVRRPAARSARGGAERPTCTPTRAKACSCRCSSARR